MRYHASLQLKDLENCRRLKLKNKKREKHGQSCTMHVRPMENGINHQFFQTYNFDLWQFCSPFSYKDAQYLILNHRSRSKWIQLKKFDSFQNYFSFTQGTSFSHHLFTGCQRCNGPPKIGIFTSFGALMGSETCFKQLTFVQFCQIIGKYIKNWRENGHKSIISRVHYFFNTLH